MRGSIFPSYPGSWKDTLSSESAPSELDRKESSLQIGESDRKVSMSKSSESKLESPELVGYIFPCLLQDNLKRATLLISCIYGRKERFLKFLRRV